MKVSTFTADLPPTQRTRSTTLSSGETFNYKKLRIREDLVDALEAMKPDNRTLTAYLNSVLEVYISKQR
jgi:hypothetical protein